MANINVIEHCGSKCINPIGVNCIVGNNVGGYYIGGSYKY